MYLILKEGKLKEIIIKAIERAGSYRNLAKNLRIPQSTIYNYKFKNETITKVNFNKLLNYLETREYEKEIVNELPDNWKQIIGGRNCVKKKIKDKTLNKQLEECRKALDYNGKSLKDWHKRMKKENIKNYYLVQYEHFKKVGHYKYLTKNGEKVRNTLEKKIANILQEKDIKYQYEPLVRIGNKYFFPDFIINDKIILECTMWRGYDKAIKLKEKIGYLNKNYKVYVIIPEKLERYYNSIKENLILGTENFKVLIEDIF